MRNIFLFLGTLLSWSAAADLPTSPVSCDYGKISADAPAETSQFAFLIGDFKVTMHAWQGANWSPPQPGVTARWNGYYGLAGMAIYDEWFRPDLAQNPKAGRGVNVRLYDAEEGVWKMMWIATTGKTVQDLRAEMRDGVLTMWQVYPERPDFQATFHVMDTDHWERISYTRDDKGTWVKQFKLAASRLPCGSH